MASTMFKPIEGYSSNEEYVQTERVLGRGSFGIVYSGYCKRTREPVAIKIVNKKKIELGWSSKAREQQMAEIKYLYYDHNSNNHQHNIVSVQKENENFEQREYMIKLFDASESDEEYRLVLELCAMNLDEYFKSLRSYNLATNYEYFFSTSKKHSKKKVKLMPVISEREIHYWVTQMSLSLQLLRKLKVVHRDIKPMNFLLKLKASSSSQSSNPSSNSNSSNSSNKQNNNNNNTAPINAGSPYNYKDYILKIADLGFAKSINNFSMLSTYCGSPHYQAPELLRKELMYGAKVDLWSIGVIILEMITGHRPKWVNPHEMSEASLLDQANKLIKHLERFNVTKELRNLVVKLLCKEDERMEFYEFFNHPFITGVKQQQQQVAVVALADKSGVAVQEDSSVLKVFKPAAMDTLVAEQQQQQQQQQVNEKVVAATVEYGEKEQQQQQQQQKPAVMKRRKTLSDSIKEHYFEDAEEEETAATAVAQPHQANEQLTISYVMVPDFEHIAKMKQLMTPISGVLDPAVNSSFSTSFTLTSESLFDKLSQATTSKSVVLVIETECFAAAKAVGGSESPQKNDWTQSYIQLQLVKNTKTSTVTEQFVCGNYFVHSMEVKREEMPCTIQFNMQLPGSLVSSILSYFMKSGDPVKFKISVQTESNGDD